MKSILESEKWTKKMSKNDIFKMSLLTKIFVLINKIYRNKLNDDSFFCDCNFLYFCVKNDLGKIYVNYIVNIWKQ
jgi:hypothetical protein